LKPAVGPLVLFRREYEGVAPALSFTIGTLAEAVAWQKKALRG